MSAIIQELGPELTRILLTFLSALLGAYLGYGFNSRKARTDDWRKAAAECLRRIAVDSELITQRIGTHLTDREIPSECSRSVIDLQIKQLSNQVSCLEFFLANSKFSEVENAVVQWRQSVTDSPYPRQGKQVGQPADVNRLNDAHRKLLLGVTKILAEDVLNGAPPTKWFWRRRK